MKYRKKPVVIEARQWDGKTLSGKKIIKWMNATTKNNTAAYCTYKGSGGEIHSIYIQTLEGEHKASPNDFIIQGIKGEFYPCKPDIFEATYEKVEEA